MAVFLLHNILWRCKLIGIRKKQLHVYTSSLTDGSDQAEDHSGEEEEGDSESGEGDDLLDGEEEEEDEEDSDGENIWIWVKSVVALVGCNSVYISSLEFDGFTQSIRKKS